MCGVFGLDCVLNKYFYFCAVQSSGEMRVDSRLRAC